MIWLAMALQAAAPQPAPPRMPDAVVLPLPGDWGQIAALQWKTRPRYDPGMTQFVKSEVEAGRCAAVRQGGLGKVVTIDVALLVDALGAVHSTRPAAIGCPTVEQYAAGLVSRVARGAVNPPTVGERGWYRTAVSFSWR